MLGYPKQAANTSGEIPRKLGPENHKDLVSLGFCYHEGGRIF